MRPVIKKNLDTLLNMFKSETPRFELLDALFHKDVEDDGWVSAALNFIWSNSVCKKHQTSNHNGHMQARARI